MNLNFIKRCLLKQGQKIILNQKLNIDINIRPFSNEKITYSYFLSHQSSITSKEKYNYKKNDKNQLFKNKISGNNIIFNRNYCTEGPPIRRLPPLMKFPEIVWPSLFKSLRNFILTHFIIRPYFDRDFSLPDFVTGTKKAVEVVSSKISEGDISALDGLVTKDIIPELQMAVSQMSLSQRQQIAIDKNDMYFSFPYQIGIMFDDDNIKPQKRFVEITMVYHVLRGLDAMKAKGEDLPLNVGMLPQYRDNISICNYRFIKEFTKGSESDWTINLLNHFKPSDYIDQ